MTRSHAINSAYGRFSDPVSIISVSLNRYGFLRLLYLNSIDNRAHPPA